VTQAYRWNVADHAAGYDAAAQHIHPYYVEIQDAILDEIARPADADFLLVDLGGGSGRLAAKFLARFPRAHAVVVDQSTAFLDLAATRLAPFGARGTCLTARLQDDWHSHLPRQPDVITSMSAIHHLAPAEKRQLYGQCYEALAPLGILLNGDEIRAADGSQYLATMRTWADHMRRVVDEGLVSEAMRPMLDQWRKRNVVDFDQPRASGDDCHEAIEAQLGYFCDCGFRGVNVPWQRELWALLKAVK
jgi:SAM-dependent methyltransferase